MSEILVIGGAGYIGSHVIIKLLENNHKIVILDNLSTGVKEAILAGTFYKGCMSDRIILSKIFKNHNISCVMLLAAYINVNESVNNPSKYYLNNVSNTLVLFDEMVKHNVLSIIYSSSASIYEATNKNKITLQTPLNPISPYARSKQIIEKCLEEYKYAYGIKYIIFRYFNASGADPKGRIGFHEFVSHLIPQTLLVAKCKNKYLNIFGDDYQTTDGTCVRDFIHVMDIASVHILGLDKLISTNLSSTFNIGSGVGYSVKEVVSMTQKVTNINIEIELKPRRKGDLPYVVSDSTYTQKILGWRLKYNSLEEIIKHSWQWIQNRH